jgi:hypothetical protein
MSAAMELHVALSLRLDATEAYRLAHAYRDEVLAKDAAERDRLAAAVDYALGWSDSATQQLRDGMEEILAAAPSEAQPAPDFYQVGHTYTDPNADYDWKFRVDAITTHPENGERTALGWRHFRGEWAEMAYGEDSFEIHLIAGMTDGGGQ